MSTETEDTTITFKLPQHLQARIKAAAEAEHRSVSAWLRFHLPEFFESRRRPALARNDLGGLCIGSDPVEPEDRELKA